MRSGLLGWIVLSAVGGAAISIQAGANQTLGRTLRSPLSAALASFAVGLVALALLLVITGAPSPTRAIGVAPWWAWVGGLLGALYVFGITAAAPRLGAGSTIALALAGQLVMAVVLDAIGWAGFVRQPLSAPRALGVLLVLGGAYLIKFY